ncbi:MAG: AAA family ATPase [Hormoscilla sp. GM7CHS1pb]|nr:AAA family ATPase [Hormoscilla sp. GM7CHS1pb]
MNLPKPIGRQKEVLYLPAQGHIAVLGTAGSGKTILAILRAAYLANLKTDHHGKTLLITFNRALVSYLKHLQEDSIADVVVENYHKFARGYLGCRHKMSFNDIFKPEDREGLIKKAIEHVSVGYGANDIFKRPVQFFAEEIRWIAQQGITTYAGYKDIENGGSYGTIIAPRDRERVFKIYEAYQELRAKRYDWDNMATAVCAELDADRSPRRYRHVVIDEGQDFSPEMIRSLAKAIPPDGSLTFLGDVAQQIYGHRISWREAGLDIKKVWEFKENYRNTQQIAKLGLEIAKMPYFRGIPDIVEPVAPKADGPLPTLVECSSIDQEIKLVVKLAIDAASVQTVAILLRDRQDENKIIQHLPMNSIRLDRNMTTWQSDPGIRYGTYHAAKGLEFDVVILPFCSGDRLPDPETVAAFGENEAMVREGRLLYVGVTRAKTRLIITYNGDVTSLLPPNWELYQRVKQ